MVHSRQDERTLFSRSAEHLQRWKNHGIMSIARSIGLWLECPHPAILSTRFTCPLYFIWMYTG
jgi:hypothetical protein